MQRINQIKNAILQLHQTLLLIHGLYKIAIVLQIQNEICVEIELVWVLV